jgi:hypothetical protein
VNLIVDLLYMGLKSHAEPSIDIKHFKQSLMVESGLNVKTIA